MHNAYQSEKIIQLQVKFFIIETVSWIGQDLQAPRSRLCMQNYFEPAIQCVLAVHGS